MTYQLAHIFNRKGGGGGKVQAENLLEEWGEHEIAGEQIEPWGVHAVNLGSPESFVSDEPGYPLMYPDRLVDGLREIDPDIVFVHGYSPQLNESLRDLAESDDFDAQWVLRKGMNVLEYWLGTPADGNPQKVIDQITALEWYDCIICPTQSVAHRTKLCYGADCPRLATVPNGIKRDEYVPSSFMKNGWLEVATASRCAPNNFLLAPVLAVLRLLDQDAFPIKMDIYGPANGQLDSVIRSVTEDVEDITVHGRVDHDELRGHLEASDVVCVPSLSHQAIPLAAVEGMAAGNIILGSFYEQHEEEAIVNVPAAHPPAWHRALTDAFEHPEDAREMVATAIERAAQYDVSTVVADGYVPIFADLLGVEEAPVRDLSAPTPAEAGAEAGPEAED